MPAFYFDVKDPATKAVWEQALEDIAEGKGSAQQNMSGRGETKEEDYSKAKKKNIS